MELSSSLEATFAALLDELVPPSGDGRLPGAGQLGLAAPIWERLGVARSLAGEGLAFLDERAAEGGGEGFADLPASGRSALVNALAAESPELLPALVFHAYTTYYQQPPVLEALGLEVRPPHPLGYELAPMDPARVARVRGLPRQYREP